MKLYAKINRNIRAHKKACDDRILIGHVLLDDGYYEVEKPDGADMVIAVADGVGGRPEGWRAASLSLQGIAALNDSGIMDPQDILKTAAAVNDELRRRSGQQEALRGMASTLSFLKVADRNASLFHLGDTRIYSLNSIQGYTVFRAVTADQNRLADINYAGDGDVEEIKRLCPDWNHITAYMGMPTEELCESAMVTENLSLTGSYLFTSDGVHDYVPEVKLRELLAAEADHRQRIEDVMRLARENGSVDDQSVVLLKTEDGSDSV